MEQRGEAMAGSPEQVACATDLGIDESQDADVLARRAAPRPHQSASLIRSRSPQSPTTPTGGNATGFTPIVSTLGGRWAEFLKEIAPRISQVRLLYNPPSAPLSRVMCRGRVAWPGGDCRAR